MENEQNLETSTSDIYLASHIWASGYKKYTTGKEEDKRRGKIRTVFKFEMTPEQFQELKESYANGTGKVSSQDFVNALRNFKNICFL